MRRILLLLITMPVLLLAGCASTIRSEVTAFHEWPAEVTQRTFVFERTDAQQRSLEYLAYENLVRAELKRVGLSEATTNETAALRATLSTSIRGRDVRIIESVMADPWFGSPWYGSGFYGPYGAWPGYGFPGYGFPYAPMWPSPPMLRQQERQTTLYQRELRVQIHVVASNKPLYDVTVKSEGTEGNLTKIMPYLVKSAFAEFPGKSGVPRVVEQKLQR